MSVTRNAARNRGADGEKTYDLFETPAHAVEALLRWPRFAAVARDRHATIIEGAAGRGAIVRALLAGGIEPDRIAAWELDARNAASLSTLPGGVAVACQVDTLTAVPSTRDDERAHVFVTNPPFSTMAGEDGIAAFAAAGLRLVRAGGLVVLLARHDWSLPKSRRVALGEIGHPAHILGLEKRCAFVRQANCRVCGGRWTSGAYDEARTLHGTTMMRPSKAVVDAGPERVAAFLAGIASCARVGATLPAPLTQDVNGYAWHVWVRGERHSEARHAVLRGPGAAGLPRV